MKPLFPMVAALSVGIAVTACAQYREQAVVAPFDRSTSPTVPDSADTRAQDQKTRASPSTNNGLSRSVANDLGYGNWRTSNGFNSDPANPSGAPGPATITSAGGSGI